jgi:hypothetical protein
MGSFAYGLVAAVSEIYENILERLGGQGDKHGYLLRRPCGRYLVIFIFRVLLENPAFVASDIAARDLISSYFRLPWELSLSDFCAFARVLAQRSGVHPAPPPGERCPGTYCATDGEAAIQVLANHGHATAAV